MIMAPPSDYTITQHIGRILLRHGPQPLNHLLSFLSLRIPDHNGEVARQLIAHYVIPSHQTCLWIEQVQLILAEHDAHFESSDGTFGWGLLDKVPLCTFRIRAGHGHHFTHAFPPLEKAPDQLPPSLERADTKPSRLMSLPTELLRIVLRHLLVVPDAVLQVDASYDYWRREHRYGTLKLQVNSKAGYTEPYAIMNVPSRLQVLGVNKKLNEEGTAIFYGANKFSFTGITLGTDEIARYFGGREAIPDYLLSSNQALVKFAATGARHLRSLCLTFEEGGLFEIFPVEIYETAACVRTYCKGLAWLQLDLVFEDDKIRIIIDEEGLTMKTAESADSERRCPGATINLQWTKATEAKVKELVDRVEEYLA